MVTNHETHPLPQGCPLVAVIAAALIVVSTASAQGGPNTSAALPDAPSRAAEQEQAPKAGKGSISGLVLDANQGLVPGAAVTLETLPAGVAEDAASPANETVPPVENTSDSEGRFRFAGLPPGRYRFTITAPGLQTFVSSEITLREGQQHEAPNIALPVAATASDVTVRVTERELAEEQIQSEMKQRVLGIIPNFYMSFVWDAAPLETKQKFKMAVRARSDPFSFFAAGVAAGIQQARNSYPSFGQGAEGYAKRYGTTYATGTLSRFFGSAVYPSLFHQDPRYFYKGTGSVGQRTWYAFTRSFVARGDNGKWQPNYSHVMGSLTAGAISNAYYPGRERGVGLTFENAALGLVFTGVGNVVREFALRHITNNVAPYNNGQKPIPSK